MLYMLFNQVMKSHLSLSAKVGNLFLVGPLLSPALMDSWSWRLAVAFCWSADVLRVEIVVEKAANIACCCCRMAARVGLIGAGVCCGGCCGGMGFVVAVGGIGLGVDVLYCCVGMEYPEVYEGLGCCAADVVNG